MDNLPFPPAETPLIAVTSPQKKKFPIIFVVLFGILFIWIVVIGVFALYIHQEHSGQSSPMYSSNSNPQIASSSSGKQFYGKRLLFTIPADIPTYAVFGYSVLKPIISSDGNHYVYVKTTAATKRYIVNYDGKDGASYENVSDLKLSTDGRHFAYIAYSNGHQFPVIDGSEGPKIYSEIANFQFTNDGKQYGYAANTKPGESVGTPEGYGTVVINGIEGPHYHAVSSFRFSPNGKRYAYIASDNNAAASFIILDGKEVRLTDNLSPDMILFSTDSAQFLVHAQSITPPAAAIYLNNQLLEKVTSGNFSESTTNKLLTFQSAPDDTKAISKPTTAKSPDGSMTIGEIQHQHGLSATTYTFGVNGVDTSIPFAHSDSVLGFTPDSKSYAYTKEAGSEGDDKYQLVFNTYTSKIYGYIDKLLFSPDGKHFAFVAHPKYPGDADTKNTYVVIDGKEGELYDEYYGLYSDSGAFRYYVLQGHNVYEVRSKY